MQWQFAKSGYTSTAIRILSFLSLGLLENFYSRQAKVYMMAKNQLFHAAALHKLFVLRKEQKKTLTKDEAVMYVGGRGGRALVAAG